jgi:hypothetical protein
MLGKSQTFKYVEGMIEIEPKRSGDILRVYIEVSPDKWFFFSYRAPQMKGISSDQSFNDHTVSGKPDSRQLKSKDGKGQYSFYISTTREKENFLKKIPVDDTE